MANSKEYSEEYQKLNKEKLAQYKRDYYLKNKEKILSKPRKQYSKEQKDKYYKSHLKRMSTDLNYKLRRYLRSRLLMAIKNSQKSGSAVKDLGCSVDDFKKYLESKFVNGMTWDNYGKDGWHIDHIKPLSSFDLTNSDQVKLACHFTNMQPLWAKDNYSKGYKVE